jgi:hypothetical protein
MAGAMLECAICGSRKWKTLEESHEEDLRMAGAARLFCEGCTRETYWTYSQHSDGAAAVRRTAAPPIRMGTADSPPAGPAAGSPGVETAPVLMRVSQTERRLGTDRRLRARRGQRRVALQVPVRVRLVSNVSQFEEITKTVNVCRNGIYIQTERPFLRGAPVYVAMNYSQREPGMASEQRATVVRVDSLAGTAARGVAIQLQ